MTFPNSGYSYLTNVTLQVEQIGLKILCPAWPTYNVTFDKEMKVTPFINLLGTKVTGNFSDFPLFFEK